MADVDVFHFCSICGQKYDPLETKDGICGGKCRTGLSHIEETVRFLGKLQRDPADIRVFFYDVGFGKLADLYTIFILRFMYAPSLAVGQEAVVQLDKLEFSLKTKLNKCSLPMDLKNRICQKVIDLYKINAVMWRIRGQENSDKSEYFSFSKKRDAIRAELDQIIEGRIKTVRI